MNPLTKQLADAVLSALESHGVSVEDAEALPLGEIVLEVCDKAMEDVTARHRRESTEYERRQLADKEALNRALSKTNEQSDVIQQQVEIVKQVREELGAMKRRLIATYDEGALWYKTMGQAIQGIK